MSARAYAQRLLQPFRGVVQVVEIDGADAVSRDGVHWELYIQGGVDHEKDDAGRWIEIPLSDIKFGSWSRRDGLSRYPTRHVTDYARIDDLGCRLLDAVREAARTLPLPLADHYELWLLDSAGRPLALIDACCAADQMAPPEGLNWRLGQVAERDFRAAEGADACTALARLVNDAIVSAAWFRRDGTRGLPVMVDAGPSVAIELPELLLREDWPDPSDRRLVARFLAWQAPWLLALSTLSRATRTRLEAIAYRRAKRVAETYRCWPQVVSPDGLKAALVEASLRCALGDDEAPVDADDAELNFFVSGN